jgi:hypothetical protein
MFQHQWQGKPSFRTEHLRTQDHGVVWKYQSLIDQDQLKLEGVLHHYTMVCWMMYNQSKKRTHHLTVVTRFHEDKTRMQERLARGEEFPLQLNLISVFSSRLQQCGVFDLFSFCKQCDPVMPKDPVLRQ